jgi:hypothetical protein
MKNSWGCKPAGGVNLGKGVTGWSAGSTTI